MLAYFQYLKTHGTNVIIKTWKMNTDSHIELVKDHLIVTLLHSERHALACRTVLQEPYKIGEQYKPSFKTFRKSSNIKLYFKKLVHCY